MGVFTEREAASRQEIMQENYCKVVNIECLTMLDMAKKDIYPAVAAYITDLCACVREKRAVSGTISVRSECELIEKLSAANESMYDRANALENLLSEAKTYSDVAVCSVFFAEKVIPAMNELRAFADEMELVTAKSTGLSRLTATFCSAFKNKSESEPRLSDGKRGSYYLQRSESVIKYTLLFERE